MRRLSVLLVLLVLVVVFVNLAIAAGRATKDECIAMCKAAAKMLEQNRDAATHEIANSQGKFVWKDSYVFLMDKNGKMLAHPFQGQLVKKDTLFKDTDYNYADPKKIFVEFVNVAFQKGQGWVDYKWLRPGDSSPANKSTFIMRVGSTDMLVGAGAYW